MDAPIIIAGSGRSGTTWVQDVLAIANDRDTVFEPLHPAGAKKARPFSYKYHDPSEKVDDLYRFINTALKGEMRTLWAVYRIRPDKFNPIKHKPKYVIAHFRKFLTHLRKYKLPSGQRALVVKFIRANLLLPWMSQNFNSPMVLLLRHPCAVIASRLSIPDRDWDAQVAIDRY
ncbi:MAG TPA: hypothetical protein ENH82_19955, partial [bacterium]|nr:hypothetical protein [bacterium]